MCSTDFGVMDFLFEKDDPSHKGLSLGSDGFKNVIFSHSEKLELDTPEIKEEELDWKMANDWDADELLRSVLNGSDMSTPAPPPLNMHGPTLASSPAPLGSAPMSVPSLGRSSPLRTPTLEATDDIDDLKDLVGLPFDVVLDSGASDSGMSSDSNFDQQMSPLSGCSAASPRSSFVDVGLGFGGFSSESGADTVSEVSSISDLGSSSPHSTSTLLAPPTSPEPISADDFITQTDSGFSSPTPQIVPELAANNCVSSPVSTLNTIGSPRTLSRVSQPTSTNMKMNPAVCAVNNARNSPPVLKTVTLTAPTSGGNVNTLGGQTIVVTQASKGGSTGQLVKGGTILKSNPTSRSILLPVTVKDFNQVRTIKIISTGTSNNVGVNGRGVRTVVSTVRQPNTSVGRVATSLNSQAAIRTALLTTVRGQDTKSLLKGGSATTMVTSGIPATRVTSSPISTSPTRSKTELEDDDEEDDEDEESRTSFQQLTLSDEEKRLLKKEGITLPTHYPLTKHEERELKRIRRKIRNKISAQDSRKRKKEYIDGLEDRVKACTEENQQLQKRIRSLEAQNESLLVQMRKFQNAVIGGSHNGRSQVHASTALMMLILSTALFVVPSLRQDGNVSDNELTLPATKISNPGHRTLLEAGSSTIIPSTLEALDTLDDEIASELDSPLVQALTDHDYTPATKRQRRFSKNNGYFVPPLDDFPPQLSKTDSGGGFPPDDGSTTKIAARIIDAVVDHSVNNFSDPGGKLSKPHTVVVSLGKAQKRLRDDLELE